MSSHERELYLSALTHCALSHHVLSDVEQRMVDRLRKRYQSECERLDKQVQRDLRKKYDGAKRSQSSI